MKSFIIAVVLAIFALPAGAASINLFGGTGQAGSQTQSSTGVAGGSGAIFAGVAGTGSQASSAGAAGAGLTIDETGIQSGTASGNISSGSSFSGALGGAAGASIYGGGSDSAAISQGQFGTIGIGVTP